MSQESVAVSLPPDMESLEKVLSEKEGLTSALISLMPGREITVKHPESKHIIQYSVPSLQTGRPLNEVIIVLSGQTGTGKSTTINKLFEDDICATSSTKSATSDVTQYKKSLTVQNVTPQILADLNFVDAPGSLDTDSTKEDENFQKICNYRESHPSLAKRNIALVASPFPIREEVYPNLVLFTVDASNNRIDGPDSSFRKAIKILAQQNLVDTKHLNLIVVATHAANLGLNPNKYSEKSRILTRTIQHILQEVFRVDFVPVAFIENTPEDFNLYKEPGSDFYTLPDGQQSHLNLIEEMQLVFKKNNDKLALLLTSWYFGSDCPDKHVKPTAKTFTFKKNESRLNKEINEAFNNLNIGGGVKNTGSDESSRENEAGGGNDGILKFLDWYPVGYAYCPVTETLKNHFIFQNDHTDKRKPTVFKKISDSKDEIKCITHNSKAEYEFSKATQYGLRTDATFILGDRVDSAAKWQTDEKNVLSVLFQKCLFSVQIVNPEEFLKQSFTAELITLPRKYDEKNAEEFLRLFRKYGTHFVSKSFFGGFIRLDFDVTKSLKDTKNKVTKKIRFIVKELTAGRDLDIKTFNQELESMGLAEGQIHIGGGDPPPFISSITDISPQMYKNWLTSVKTKPVELKHSRQLYPIYDICQRQNSNALETATLEYLEGKLKSIPGKNRDEIAKSGVESAEKNDGASCFPASTLVVTLKGCKPISELQRNDKLLTVVKSGLLKWTPFCTFLHREEKALAYFLQLHFSSGKKLTVTGTHLLLAVEDDGKILKPRQAKDMKMGDRMLYCEQGGIIATAELVNISVVEDVGIYCPLTLEGTFLASGFMVTCYADIQDFATAHMSFAPLRSWYRFKPQILGWTSNQRIEGIHRYAMMLMKLRKIVPVKIV